MATEKRTARQLAAVFGGNPDDVQVEIGTPNGWGWADVVLAAHLPNDSNPYEYAAYGLIADDWPSACDAVEAGEKRADEQLRGLLAKYRDSFIK